MTFYVAGKLISPDLSIILKFLTITYQKKFDLVGFEPGPLVKKDISQMMDFNRKVVTFVGQYYYLLV